MSRISDLILRQGDIRAHAAQARGQHRASVISGIAGYLPAVRRDYAEIAAGREDAIDRDLKRRETVGGIRNTDSQIAGRDADQQAEAEARAVAAKAREIDGWLTSVASETNPEFQTMAWQTGRQKLLEAGVIDPSDYPEQYHGPGYLKGQILRLLPVKERFEKMFPEADKPGTREVKVRNADGSERIDIVADTPGQSFTSAAPPKPEGRKYQVRVPDPKTGRPITRLATEEEMAAGVAEYQEPRQGPAPSYQWAADPKTGESRLMSVQEIRATGAQPIQQNRVPTEAERKAASFYPQMEQAIGNIEALEDKLTELDLYQFSLPQEGMFGALNRSKLSDVGKRYIQALEQFTEARLRPVSGAVISPKEYEQDRRTYARQFSETPELAAQRAESRRRAFNSLGTMSGRAAPGQSQGGGAGGAVTVTTPDGQTFTFQNQQRADQFKRQAGIP